MSGISATGSTVIVGLDTAPAGLLLWRWLLIWFGGFGFVTLAVLVLPFLRIGGLQLFVLDLSAQSGKFVPRMIDVVVKIALVYVGITADRRHRLPPRGDEHLRCHRPLDGGGRHRRLLVARRRHRLVSRARRSSGPRRR